MSEQVQQATHIRRVKLEDKEDVLKIHGDVHDGLDCLPAYYDYFVSRPNIYSVAVFYGEKMVGFMVIHIYDNGLTALIRSGRISPDYQRQGLLIPLFRHVKEWAIENGVETVISTERELKPLQEKRKERRVKSLYFWSYVMFSVDTRSLIICPEDMQMARDLVPVSDPDLSELFKDSRIVDYIAPTGLLMVHVVPLKPVVENITCIRGLENSTVIYSDINFESGEYGGLLSCCTKFNTPSSSKYGHAYYVDMFGTDASRVKKHIVRHFMDIEKLSGAMFYVSLPDGVDFGEVTKVLTEYNIEFDGSQFTKSACPRVHLYEWWRREKCHI